MFGHAWRIGLPSRTFGLGLGLVRCQSLSDWLLPCFLLHCSLCVQLPDQADKANDCSVSEWTQAAKRIIVRSNVLDVEHLEQLFAISCWMGSPVLLKRMIVRSRRLSSCKLLHISYGGQHAAADKRTIVRSGTRPQAARCCEYWQLEKKTN